MLAFPSLHTKHQYMLFIFYNACIQLLKKKYTDSIKRSSKGKPLQHIISSVSCLNVKTAYHITSK
jgi:hypothetical protein